LHGRTKLRRGFERRREFDGFLKEKPVFVEVYWGVEDVQDRVNPNLIVRWWDLWSGFPARSWGW
jgi:hypothetical protein